MSLSVSELHNLLGLALEMGVNPDSKVCIADTIGAEWASLSHVVTPAFDDWNPDGNEGYVWLTLYPGDELDYRVDYAVHERR